MRGDHDAARRLVAAHPEYLRYPGPMQIAASSDRVDVVAFLLDLGMSPDVEHGSWTGLHSAAGADAVRVAELLIERGATVDKREEKYHATPLGHGVWGGRSRVAGVLSRVSRDVFALTSSGNLDRLRAVLEEDPSLATATLEGSAPLFSLSPPEERALEIAELLLGRGADPDVVDTDGLTAADVAARSGLEDLADLLREARA